MAGKRRGNLNLKKEKEDEQAPYQWSSQRKSTANNRENAWESESSPKRNEENNRHTRSALTKEEKQRMLSAGQEVQPAAE